MERVTAHGHPSESAVGRIYAHARGSGAPPPTGLRPGEACPIELRLVARLHVDLLRVSSAGCRRSR